MNTFFWQKGSILAEELICIPRAIQHSKTSGAKKCEKPKQYDTAGGASRGKAKKAGLSW
jgi:hypothetical protein